MTDVALGRGSDAARVHFPARRETVGGFRYNLRPRVIVHIVFIVFFFALGACVGSFLNVVVWRVPRGESIVSPPSHCPKCDHKLAWRDNIPVFGWIALRGKCRYCGASISPRYPIIEAITGLLFVGYYVMFFVLQTGPCPPVPLRAINDDGLPVEMKTLMYIDQHWPIYLLYMFLVACLMAASLIDAELYIIPIEIPWIAAGVGIVVHAIIDRPTAPGALNVGPLGAALAAGGAVGLILSMLLLRFKVLPQSFAEGGPALEIDKQRAAQGKDLPPTHIANEPFVEMSRGELRAEIRKEMLFLLPPLVLAGLWMVLCWKVGPVAQLWLVLTGYHWLSGMLGAVLGALVGALVVWLTRILGSLGFGREAMGLGDVHLMFGVGAVVGAGAATVAFFIAPFFGILVALYLYITHAKRELPYGPYLSLATLFLMLFYCPIASYLAPGVQGLGFMLQSLFGGGGAAGSAGL